MKTRMGWLSVWTLRSNRGLELASGAVLDDDDCWLGGGVGW
jgi:hypothetical protein